MSKYYALKVEEEIVFIIPWDKQQDPFLSDFQFAIAKVWGKLGSDFVPADYKGWLLKPAGHKKIINYTNAYRGKKQIE